MPFGRRGVGRLNHNGLGLMIAGQSERMDGRSLYKHA
ncbi:MAG: hypothetical protein BWX84_02985 [Verrucomicrobia bacterium ADurb.Bin118]|nr:MAG: hypothetical protein BWX84_02985 [Verrucomicrobia bacterium ADurb.Bin118]